MTFTTHIAPKHRTRLAAGLRARVDVEATVLGQSPRRMGSVHRGERSTK